ncbi:MAG TPA: iron-sulfur cluster-binding domain-containing protein [Puia sp.]|nr:iron-sulfur cluster-binding domain-containing protein [Puia sp.]
MVVWFLRVVAVRTEAYDTKTIFLRREDNQPFPYAAGQFLTFLFKRHGRDLRRSYSFCTTPGIDPLPGITVKRVTNGEISRYLLDQLQPGDLLKSLPPSGRFFLGKDAETHVFIAAGSGLVPVFSLVKQALSRLSNPACQTLLLTQQHDAASTPFRDELEALASGRNERTSGGSGRTPLETLASGHGNPVTIRSGRGAFKWIDWLTVRDGRINNWRLEEWLFALLSREAIARTQFYLCGPPAFMRMAEFTLRTLGIAETQIRKEHFTVEHQPGPPPDFDDTAKKVVLRAGSERHVFEAKWPKTILQAGLDRGIPLPYSCRAGRCSSCVARCMQGRVRMTNNEVLTDSDLRDGLILTCVGYAETDVELTFGNPDAPA